MAISIPRQRCIQFVERQSVVLVSSSLTITFSGRSVDKFSQRFKGVPFAAIVIHEPGAGGFEDFAIYHNCFWPEGKPIYGFAHPRLPDPGSVIKINSNAFCDPMDF